MEIRRFVNQDIILGSVYDGQSLNQFSYVNGEPIDNVDPFGLSRDSVEDLNKGKIILASYHTTSMWDDFLSIPLMVKHDVSKSVHDPDIQQGAKNCGVALVKLSPIGLGATIYNKIPGAPKLNADKATENAISKVIIVRMASPSSVVKYANTVKQWFQK